MNPPASPATIHIQPIGIIHSCFPEKFGIPRQPGLVQDATGFIKLYDWISPESLEGLEKFSHLWIFFQFHQAVKRGWKPRVRPPRLGGNTKIGVFGSRSPQRPNFMGQSAVKINRVDQTRRRLYISGLDILDQTPVVDIKPYIPYTDSIPQASEGYAPEPASSLQVIFNKECQQICAIDQKQHNRNLQQLITQILQQDPRPAYHNDNRTYGMQLWDLNIRFTCINSTITVNHIQKSTRNHE